MPKAPVSVVVLAHNEAVNIRACLSHLVGWAEQVFVLDSGSTDRTIAIAKEFGATVVEHAFQGYVEQRNWALRELPIRHEWVFFVDTDEYPTEELKAEIGELINDKRQTTNNVNIGKSDFPGKSDFQSIDGFYIKRRFIWEGRWIRHGGYYPVWILRLMRRSAARCEGQLMDEHFAVTGATERLAHDLVHDDRRGLADWKEKHRRYAVLKAREYVQRKQTTNNKLQTTNGQTDKRATADTEQERRASRRSAYDRLPLFLRAFLYFIYVFFVQGGFLDGPRGWRYHVLHGLWYPLLIDWEIVRLRRSAPPS